MFKNLFKVKNPLYVEISYNKMSFKLIGTDKTCVIRDVDFSDERMLVADFDKALYAFKMAMNGVYPKYTLLRPVVIINLISKNDMLPIEEQVAKELGISIGRKVIICKKKNPSSKEILELANE